MPIDPRPLAEHWEAAGKAADRALITWLAQQPLADLLVLLGATAQAAGVRMGASEGAVLMQAANLVLMEEEQRTRSN